MSRDADRLSVVMFTAGPLRPVHRTVLKRLCRERALSVRGIVVSGMEPTPLPTARDRVTALALAMYERLHPPLRGDDYATLERDTGVPVHIVDRVDDAHAAAIIGSLRPHLGVVVGGRAPDSRCFSYGTVALRARRHGGEITLTIEHAVPGSRQAAVLGERTFAIEEQDSDASVKIKAELGGAQLCLDAVRRAAASFAARLPLPALRPSDSLPDGARDIEQLTGVARRRTGRSALQHARLLLQYAVLSPKLAGTGRRLAREGRAPIAVLYYHLVANRPLNHMCVPLEDFVEQVDFLRRHHPVLSLDEAVERLRSGKNDEVASALTFDDGYRDNAWAIEYLRYFEIPACFFISIGHVLDGSAFEHDSQRGFTEALPMTAADVRRLTAEGFLVGSHGVHHEDFGTLDAAQADRTLAESRRLLAEVSGQEPEHFSFPKGKRGTNITADTFRLALKHYRYVHSAYGGYNVPATDRRHFVRIGNPTDRLDLAMLMDGYTGARQVLAGDAWGVKTNAVRPY
jgi:peptidoglycan/xylan/chitin deacetylase (PgdA/CDA1 family)